MTEFKDEHIGERINIYDILYLCDSKSNDGHKLYHIKCTECGWENDVQYRHIKHLSSVCNHTSCSGMYINFNGKIKWKNKRLQKIFQGMCSRCYNENNKDYNTYGEKGVRICKEWLNDPLEFEDWALNGGYQDGLTIDRINSDKDYCPENCRWISLKDNAKYKSTTSLINVNGEIHTGRDWAKNLGLGVNRINTYVREYGIDNTVEFIKRYIENPYLKPKGNQNYYNLYMNDDNKFNSII